MAESKTDKPDSAANGVIRSRGAKSLAMLGAVAPAVVVVLLGWIGLHHPTPAWTTFFVSAAAVLPLLMVVAGLYGKAVRRPRRLAFAICCGGYFLFFNMFADSPYLTNMFTTKLISVCEDRLFYSNPANVAAAAAKKPTVPNGGFGGSFGTGQGPAVVTEDDIEIGTNFPLIGQSLWALLFGCIGGIAACFFGQPASDRRGG